jgi:hypothetical protein
MNVYRTADDNWFMLVVMPDKLAALAKGIGRTDLLSDARFSDAASLKANMAQLTTILDDVFRSQPMAHWQDVFEQAHITFGVVKEPSAVINDPQLRENDIVVPIEGAGGNLKFTISSPIKMHGVTKVRKPSVCKLVIKGKNMPELQTSKRASGGIAAVGRLFVLELSDGRVLSMKPDGSDKKIILTECRNPDGIVVDVDAGHIYWTNMGVLDLNDGSIERADIDGKNRKVIVPEGGTFTPKQLHLDKQNRKLYWCDREGMRVMRSNLDGSQIETLVEAGRGDADRRDQTRWCVGITVDPKRGQIYWTQKGPDNGELGRILRANVDLPKGESAANRSDIEVLFNGLPEPIDLELDLKNRVLYWTDRGDPPRGNTVNRTPIDVKPKPGDAPEILLTHLMEGIGIALDVPNDRMFLTDLAGSIYSARLNGSEKRMFLYAQGNLTGIAYAQF